MSRNEDHIMKLCNVVDTRHVSNSILVFSTTPSFLPVHASSPHSSHTTPSIPTPNPLKPNNPITPKRPPLQTQRQKIRLLNLLLPPHKLLHVPIHPRELPLQELRFGTAEPEDEVPR